MPKAVQPIQRADRLHLLAAEGWLDLRNPTEAVEEWKQLSAFAQKHPAGIEIHWRIQALRKQWAEALETAEALLELDESHPVGWIHRAYALHELARTEQAYDSLKPAAEKFPKETTIPYNLACYSCHLGDLSGARKWLKEAVNRKGKKEIQSIALADKDLEPLWPEISEW